ncbi:MAG TPA: YbaK/EbsC family protein [Thermoguttaceae bacterium]|nr:YbaK/EbsC family protein [Thermoguttaceae bacterium]
MPANLVKAFLDENQIKYTTIRHSQAFTAQEIAHSVHISGKDIAKTVIVKIDGRLVMVVLPASDHVVLSMLQEITGADNVELATEREFKDRFPGCEIGAMPPLGNLFDMDVYVSSVLSENDEIAFNAGTHTELIRMKYADYERLVQPNVVRVSYSSSGWI